MFNKSIKYGKYKLYYNVKKKDLNYINKMIKDNIEIQNLGNGEVKFILNNLNNILQYGVDNFTNLKKFKELPYDVKELVKTDNNDLKLLIKSLKDILRKLLEVNKDIIINKIDDIGKILKEIKNEI